MRLLHVARDISLFLTAAGPRRGAGRGRAPLGCCVRPSARRARDAQLRRAARRPGRDADVGAGARDRAVSADLDRRRTGRRRLRGDRRAHRSQVALAPRALDGCGRARRGRRLAPGPTGSFGDARAARRAGARSRPRRRVERDLGEAGAARLRRVGARPAPPPLHRARLRPVADARSARDARRHAPRTTRRLRLPPRHARPGARPAGPHPRRRRLLQRDARARPYRPALDAAAAEAELLREAQEGRLDPDAVDAVLNAGGHRVPPARLATCRPG